MINVNLKFVSYTIVIGLAIYLTIYLKQPFGAIALVWIMVNLIFQFFKKQKPVNLPYTKLFFPACVVIAGLTFKLFAISKEKQFENNTPTIFVKMPFDSVLYLSKQMNKSIFIDFYATWCPPCLAFQNDVLTDTLVGTKMNTAFINVKYDAEYGEGKVLAKKYGVKVYPTLLVLDGNGNIKQEVAKENVPTKQQMIALAETYLVK
jgi:thiol-disulfide isomerase/thioredoxin